MNQTLNFWMSLSASPAGPNNLLKRRVQIKRIFFVFIFLLGASTLLAETSKEFIFFGDLLDALKFCRASIEYRIIAKRPTAEMIADTDEANVIFEKARHLLERYARDSDEVISQRANAIINAMDILIYSNDVLNGKLQNVVGLIPNGFDDTVSETTRFRSQSKKGWDALFLSLESQEIKRVISRISKEEKQKLIEKIDTLFSQAPEVPTEEGEIEILKEEKKELYRRFGEIMAIIKKLLSD